MVVLSLTTGKLVRMWENVAHSSRVCSTVSTAPSSQKRDMVVRGSSSVHFPILHRKLWEAVRIDATFLCAEMFTGSRR